jgi:anaerobic selenocysteine-containing dehydrogenase
MELTMPRKNRIGTAKEADAAIPKRPTSGKPNLLSACQQCNTNCGIKVKLRDGVVENRRQPLQPLQHDAADSGRTRPSPRRP